ncbi:MAG: TetR/AcrR family transcriptional regulator [Caulobacterales bacterium]
MSRERTRALLREAAGREFASRGLSATSIDMIASAAGFSRGAFYSNYEDKHDLLAEIVDDSNHVEIDAWRKIICGPQSVDDALAVIADRFNNYTSQRDWPMLVAEIQIEAKRNPAFEERVRERGERTLQEIAELIGILARKAGKSDLDVEGVTLTLRGLVTGLVLHASEFTRRPVGDLLAGYLRSVLRIDRSR